MDNPAHAPLMKECFHCHHWALLTQANWPKSSRDDPSKSCCRKCHILKKVPVEDSDSSEEAINTSLEHLRLKDDTIPDSSSAYASCPNTSPSTASGTICSKERLTTSEKQNNEREKQFRTTMASRWAFDPSVLGPDEQESAIASENKTTKDWFKRRDDLFNGNVTVNDSSAKVFSNASRRIEKKAKGTTKSSETRSPLLSTPLSAVGGGQIRLQNKPAPLTGANSMAVGGDNGWMDGSDRENQMDRIALGGLLCRDVPPHMNASRLSASRLDKHDGDDSGYGMSPESSKRQNLASPNGDKGLKDLIDHNEKLREAIARMEQRNFGMLSRPPLKGMPPKNVMEDSNQIGQAGRLWM